MNNQQILAVDPGTQCGWAFSLHGNVLTGVWNLKGGRFEGGGMRFVRLGRILEQFCTDHPMLDQVVFEEVRRHLGTDAAHIYGGIIATLSAWCEEHDIPYEGIPVGTIKKFATGKGNANKAAMIEAARKKWPERAWENSDEVDARWLLELALDAI